MEVTVKLLENAMREALESYTASPPVGWEDGRGRFLIDGFPRKMDQALKFDEDVRGLLPCFDVSVDFVTGLPVVVCPLLLLH